MDHYDVDTKERRSTATGVADDEQAADEATGKKESHHCAATGAP